MTRTTVFSIFSRICQRIPVRLAGLPRDGVAQMVGIDAEGFQLRIGRALHWLPFAEPCTSAEAVRAALVQLARASFWPSAPEAN